jgi:hypothetical protein
VGGADRIGEPRSGSARCADSRSSPLRHPDSR